MGKKGIQSESSSDDQDDEIVEIKRAMREAKMRKKCMTSKLKMQWERDNSERSEMEEILRKSSQEADELRRRVTQLEFDLKESRYETTQWSNKYQALQEDKKLSEASLQSKINELNVKLENSQKLHDERYLVITSESDKVCKILDSFFDTAQLKQADSVSKTMRHLMRKAVACMEKVKMATASSSVNLAELKAQSSSYNREINTAESAVDAAMLEMCKNLEEENVSMSRTMEELKQQLVEAKREASASQLIPHYRLAILRARTYAANLLEQIQREQATSQALREQLDETYADLKKVVEEKRRLYKRISKTGLSEEQALHTIDSITTDQRGCVSTSVRDRRSENSSPSSARRESSSQYERRFHNIDEKTSKVLHALSTIDGREASEHFNQVDMERSLKSELQTLDDQIDMLKNKLGQAAFLQSQKILTDVIDSSLSNLPQSL